MFVVEAFHLGKYLHYIGVEGFEFAFVFSSFLYGVASLESFEFALPFFPSIRYDGVFGRVFDTCGVVLPHLFIQYFERNISDGYSCRVGVCDYLFYSCSRQIFGGSARISEYEGEIALFELFYGDGEIIFWFERNVVGRIWSRTVVFVGIYPENGEVARVSRVFPVVGIGTKLAYRLRRCGYKPYIVVSLA